MPRSRRAGMDEVGFGVARYILPFDLSKSKRAEQKEYSILKKSHPKLLTSSPV